MLNTGEEIGLATIYRVLTQFEQAGLLIRHHFESDKAVFELNEKSHHDHIVCLQCGHVEEFRNDTINMLEIGIWSPYYPGASVKAWTKYFKKAKKILNV